MTTGDVRAAAAERAVRGFIERHQKSPEARIIDLASFAALPVALSPDLLHLIRVNFFPGLRYTAESSLLLSRLCVEIGDGLYEMPPETRALLLRRLYETQPARRVQQMAALLWEYSAGGAWPDNEQLARAQQLTALNLLAPEKARAWLDEAEAQRVGGLATDGAREWFVAMRAEVQWQTDVTAAAQTPEIAKAAMFELGGLMPFIRALNEYFNLTELQSLSFDLDVYFEELPGDTKSSKARELVLYLWRQDRIDELQEAIRRVRPALGDLGFVQPPPPVAPEPVAVDPAALRQFLDNLFSPDEFQMLLLELNVNYDDLPGATNQDKVRELVSHLERRGRLAELQALVRRERPDVYDAAAGVASPEQSPPPEATASPSALHEFLIEYFTSDELQDLTFTLDINWEDLSGANRQGKARELVSYLERRGLLNRLQDYLRQQWPAAYAARFDQPLSFPTKQFLAIDERQQLADVLSRTSWLQSPAPFRQLLSYAGLDRFVPALQLYSPPRLLAADLISRLEPFGVLPEQPARHALGALLDFILRDAATPPEDARFLAGLIVKHNLVADEAYLDWLADGYKPDVAARPSPEEKSQPDYAQLRQFIVGNFSDDELENFCFDYFPQVSAEFSPGMSVNRKAIALIAYANRRGRMDDLRAALARERPKEWWASFYVPGQEGPNNQKPLSKRQERILQFIREYASEYGRAPTIREIGKAVGINSTSVVNYNLSKLEEKGYLVRDPDVSRGLQLVSTPTQGRDPRQVFISHANLDAEFAHRLAGDLQAEGWHIWIAPDNIHAGEQWTTAIARGLAESGVYLLVLSPTAAKSNWVFWETSLAIAWEQKGEIRFIPILYQPGSFPAMWQAYQHVVFERDYDAGLKELLSRLRAQPAETLQESAATPPTKAPIATASTIPSAPAPRPVANRLHEKTGIELVHIPAGSFLLAENNREIDLPEYWIGRYPVTNGQFDYFVRATNYRTTAEQKGYGHVLQQGKWVRQAGAYWRQPEGPDSSVEGRWNHPVVQVSSTDALAFAQWAGMRLPTEMEWEKAARGSGSRQFPWGNQKPWAELLNYNRQVGGTSPVGLFSPQGDSPYGAADMAGNVWEWTSTPYDQDDKLLVLKGGSWADPETSWLRGAADPLHCQGSIGFRLAATIVER